MLWSFSREQFPALRVVGHEDDATGRKSKMMFERQRGRGNLSSEVETLFVFAPASIGIDRV